MKMSLCGEKEAKRLFQKLQFHNTSIEKLPIKHLKNIDLLSELPFYNELSIKSMRLIRSIKLIELIKLKKLCLLLLFQ